jgi:thioredoxin-related protein
MLRRLHVILAVVLAVSAPGLARAVQHDLPEPRPSPNMALIVIEVPGCFYCRLFRRDVRPAYEATARAREVPMYFLDLEAAKARQLAFDRPIDVLPTVVIFRNGREVSRVPGYMAPDNFVRVINYLLSRTG